MSLAQRQLEYEQATDLTLTRRVPIVLRASLRNYTRLTKNILPFSSMMADVMQKTMMFAIMEMQGSIFGFQHYNEISFILRNDLKLDSEPWYQNKLQKLNSITSSLVTRGFDKFSLTVPELDLVGEPIFEVTVFTLPYIMEVFNYLVYRQHLGFASMVDAIAQFEVTQKIGERAAYKLLKNKNSLEKIELLNQEFQILLGEKYPESVLRGTAAYKIPTLNPEKGNIRNKWAVNGNLPFLTEEKDLIYNILLTGNDLFRASSIDETT